MANDIPLQAKKYFWGDDLDQLNWHDHKQYIVQTLLDRGDIKSVSWLLQKTSSDQILEILPSLKLSKKTRNFWQIYLS